MLKYVCIAFVIFCLLSILVLNAQKSGPEPKDGLYFYDVGTMKGSVNLGVHADMPTYGKPGTFWIVKNGVWYPVDETMVEIPKNGGFRYDAEKRKLIAIEQ